MVVMSSMQPVLALAQDQKRSVLPLGVHTLHHPGCGCPPALLARPGQRAADMVDALVQRCQSMYQHQLLAPHRPLRIGYVLPHHNITGGMKCLVEHIRLLRQRGHYVVAVHRSNAAASAMPPCESLAVAQQARACMRAPAPSLTCGSASWCECVPWRPMDLRLYDLQGLMCAQTQMWWCACMSG